MTDAAPGSRRAGIAWASGPGEPEAAVAETATAVLFFVGDHVYKKKKPLDLGFVDFRQRSARLAACRREVRLNRRLAPDVYKGIATVRGPDGKVCEHLVVMRRLPASRRLATLARKGEPVDDALRDVARQVAAMHASSRHSRLIDKAAALDATRARWHVNAARMEHLVGSLFDRPSFDRVGVLADRYLAGRRPLFEERVAEGWSCDGHGDLLAEDIFCLDDGARVLDCLEFDDSLRHGDALGDVAFLAMDLEHLGRPDLAGRFLDWYREFAAGTWPASLAHHHIAYRAQVRALVHGLRWEQEGEPASGDGGGNGGQARELLDLAIRHLEAGRVRLVVVGGAPGTGKSTLSKAIAESIDAVVVSSDEVRKQRAGLDLAVSAPAPLDSDLYEPSAKEATYDEMLGLADRLLARGESVVLDATFARERHRQRARSLAEAGVADLGALECTAPPALVTRRLEGAGGERGASDAEAGLALRLAERQQPWPEAVKLDTSAPLSRTLARALEVLDAGAGGAAPRREDEGHRGTGGP